MEQSPLLVVLKIVDSFLSPFPSPPDRPGSRDEIPCWWCCIVTAQISQKLKKICFRCESFDCLICLRCLHPRFIDRRLFIPPILVPDGDRPLPPRHSTFATPGFTRSPSRKPHKTSRSQRNEKPRLISKWDIFIVRRKVFSERFQCEVNASGSTR